MADTIPNIPLVAGVWTELYAASTITVGTQLGIQNLGISPLYLHAGPDEPTGVDGFKLLPAEREAVNKTGDTGAWVLSKIVDSVVNVAVA